MSKRKRRANFTGEQKGAILREHLLEGVAVAELCDRHGLQPSQFYAWQKQLFERGAKALERTPNGRERELARKVEKLETSETPSWTSSPTGAAGRGSSRRSSSPGSASRAVATSRLYWFSRNRTFGGDEGATLYP